jgi:hypothetical protein
MARQRHFEVHTTTRQKALEGLPLAFFWQRLLGYFIDLLVAVTLWAPSEFAWRRFVLREHDFHMVWDFHEKGNLIAMLVYYGLANYLGNGQTIGKLIARTRAVSLKHERLTFLAIYRASSRLWRGGTRRRSRLCAVLLGSQSAVRARPARGNNRGGREKVSTPGKPAS